MPEARCSAPGRGLAGLEVVDAELSSEGWVEVGERIERGPGVVGSSFISTVEMVVVGGEGRGMVWSVNSLSFLWEWLKSGFEGGFWSFAISVAGFWGDMLTLSVSLLGYDKKCQ